MGEKKRRLRDLLVPRVVFEPTRDHGETVVEAPPEDKPLPETPGPNEFRPPPNRMPERVPPRAPDPRPPSAGLDGGAMFHPMLPTEAKHVTYTGQHLWIVMVAYEIDPYLLSQADQIKIEARSALDVAKPFCYWCEVEWTLRNGRGKCRGPR